MVSETEITRCLKLVADKYGIEFAKTIERLFRNETAHFKSGGFQKTFSAGMEAFGAAFPYGWSSLSDFWITNRQYAPAGIIKQRENTSAMLASRGERSFIKFPNLEASMMSVAFLIAKRGGEGGSWFSLFDKKLKEKYNTELLKIIPRIVNTFK